MNARPATQAPPDVPPASTQRNEQHMAEAIHARSGWGALLAGLRRGFHPQLLLVWTLMLWLPAAIAALPAAIWLYLQFGHSPQGAAIAADTGATFIADALSQMQGEGALIAASAGLALLLSLLLSPWLSGMIVAQIRTVYRLRMGGVLRAGLGEYTRMLRMLAWSIVLMAIACAIGVGLMIAIEAITMRFATGTEDLAPSRAGWFLPLLLVGIVHVTVEAGRGWLGADLALRSVFEAWKRGVTLLLRQPGATLTVYLGTSLVGDGLALLFLRLRALADAAQWPGWLLAFVCTQLVVASLAWGRSARLHGLADLATAHVIAQQRPPAATAPANDEHVPSDKD